MTATRPTRLVRSTLLLLAVAAAASAHARDVILRLPLATALSDVPTKRNLGDLAPRFGTASATGAEIVAADVQVAGSAEPTWTPAAQQNAGRPSDQEVCQRAFADAMARLADAVRKAGATTAVGIVSDYKNVIFDNPDAYECHAATFRSFVWLKAQLARSLPVAAGAKEGPP